MSVTAIRVEGVWWRQVPRGGDPLFRADPERRRWQRGEVVGGVYFADSEKTAWAEWYRALAEFAIPPDRQMPRDLWRWQIEIEPVADLSTVNALAEAGLMPRSTQTQWPAFQNVEERLWSDGYAGVLASSASRPGSFVLCLFRQVEEVVGGAPVRPPITYRRAPAPPTGMTT